MNEKEIILSLVVIRSANMDRASMFYAALGLQLSKHAHGRTPEHYSGVVGDSVFEIYPAQDAQDITARTRLGFKVVSVKKVIESIQKLGAKVLTEPAQTAFGFSATIQDFDGHKIELYEMS